MASSNTDSPGTIYRWIERKPLTEAVTWTSREKFWLITAACHYGTHDWKSVAQVVRNAGEPYRPREWYTPKSCERQFKILVSNLSKEVKSLPLIDMLKHIAEGLKNDYIRDANKSKDTLKSKYCNLFSVLNRVKQGNLSRNEVVSLYSQARRNEIEGKQYMDQLMTRQNASLASENSSSGLIEEQPIKWNTPSAPLLTSLLRSRNTIPVNRTATTIASLLQSPAGTSRTRSGKLLPLTPSIRTTQGTPTLSKLLEAPANPYIPSPPQTTQKNKLSEVGTERLANTSRKENSQSTSLNRVRVDNMTTLGSFNQINKSDLSASKKQISKSPVSVVKNGSKSNSSVVNLLSDSETDEETKNTSLKSLLGDKKDTSSRLEPRATRSQTRAEGSFKQLNNTKLSDGKKERESLRQQSGGSQINETQIIDDDLIDIDQIEVEPLSSVQDEIQSPTPSKMTRSSLQRLRLLSPGDNLLTKANSKEISNKMLEEISADFVLNSAPRTVDPAYKCLLGVPDNSDSSESLIPVDRNACKDAIMIRKESQLQQNKLTTTYNGKLLKQKRIIDLKAANIRCIDTRNDSKILSYNNQPIVVVNKIKKPFNIQFASEQRNKTDDIKVSNTDVKKPMRLNNSSQNVVKLIDSNCSLAADEVIIIDDDININEDNRSTMKTKELLSKGESKTLPSTVSNNLKTTVHQLDDKKNKNDKSPWNLFEKTQNILDTTKKQSHQYSVSKSGTNSNINESNNRFIKELDFDFDQSISPTSLSELYNGGDDIVGMHSFDNEELNSLIECGSLDSNDTEERIDPVGADQGDSSVSESDSTIGAFDTFAQITRVRQKSFTSKGIKKLDTKDLKTTSQEVKHLKVSFCQSEEMYNDKTSTASSVPGIPILKGVISNVMSQIGLDSVASTKLPTDVVEIISSDEEVMVDVPKAHPLDVMQIQRQEKEVKSYKLLKNDDELIKIHEKEAKMYKGVNMKQRTNAIKPLNIEMPQCIIVKNVTSDAVRIARNKILELKEDIAQKYNYQDIEMTVVSNTGNIRKGNGSFVAEVIQPQGITVKIANDKLIKETEKMKKDGEEKKKKEYERKKKEDNERKKKEDDERKRKEDERKKKEDDRMKRELEKKRQYELLVKKKNEEEERKNKEDDERKKKEAERKIKDLQEKKKIEEQKKFEKNKKDEENDDKIIREKLKEFRNSMRDELFKGNGNINIPMNAVVVKEESIDEDYVGFYTHSNESSFTHGRLIKEELIDDQIFDEQIFDEQIFDEQIVHEQIVHEQIIKEEIIDEEEIMNEEIMNEEIVNDEIISERIVNEEVIHEELIDEDSCIDDEFDGELEMQSCEDDDLPLKTNLMSRTEITKIRNLESFEKSLKRRNKVKKWKNSEDLKNNREIKITARGVQVQRGYIGCQRQTIEQQPNVSEVAKKQRAVEAETQKKSKEENELISGALKEYNIRRAKEYELLSLELAENIEKKKSRKDELRKSIAVEEIALKGINKRSLKKLKEPENNQSVGHTNVNLSKNYGVPPVHFKKKNDVETDTNIEQGLFKSRRAATKNDVETFNVKERGIKKLVGSERKSTKGIETMSTEVKMITRTRRLKGEEKLKESNISKNVSTKLRSQIKCPGSSSSSASPTSEENPSIPSYEYKKQTKNTGDTSKRNSTSNTLYVNKNNRDLNKLNREVIDIPRPRTRSSSFKQPSISETRSSKQDQNNVAAVIPKETVRTKTIVSTSTHPDDRTTKSKSPPKTILNEKTLNDHNGGKTLVIPVVMLTTSEIPLHKINQRSVTSFIKQQEIKPTHDQIQKQVVTTKQLDKPPPKKRGRKPRIKVQNKKLQNKKLQNKKLQNKELQKSKSSNETTSQNLVEMRTVIKEIEPLAKRTRSSLGLQNNSTNKQFDIAQPHKTTVEPFRNKEESVENFSMEKRLSKTDLKFIFDKICEHFKNISILNNEVTNASSQCVDILKHRVELQEIESCINSGEITKLNDLIVKFLILSHNAAMMNNSTSIIFKEASKFQLDLQRKCQKLLYAAGENNSDCQDLPKICSALSKKGYSPFNSTYTEKDLAQINDTYNLSKKAYIDGMGDYMNTTDEYSESDESDTPPPIKKRKKNISYSSSSESD